MCQWMCVCEGVYVKVRYVNFELIIFLRFLILIYIYETPTFLCNQLQIFHHCYNGAFWMTTVSQLMQNHSAHPFASWLYSNSACWYRYLYVCCYVCARAYAPMYACVCVMCMYVRVLARCIFIWYSSTHCCTLLKYFMSLIF